MLVHNVCGDSPNTKRKAGEESVKKETGLDKNTTKIEVDGRNRIPDFIGDKTVIEVKNVQKQSYTQQLKDSVKIAKAQGKTFELWPRPNTILSGPLQEAVDKKITVHKATLFT